MGLALGTNLKFCSSAEKRLKLKNKKFWGPNPTSVDVKGEKLVGGPFCSTPFLNKANIKTVDSSIQNRQKACSSNFSFGILSFNSYLDIRSINMIFSVLGKMKINF